MKYRNLFGLVCVTGLMACAGFEMPGESEKSDAFVAIDTSQPDTSVPDYGQPDAGEEPEATLVEEEAQTDTIAPDTFVPDQMVEVCVPACNGKACGDDGCGGVCGMCVADACSRPCVRPASVSSR